VGEAGQRSLGRSALVEAVEQLSRALTQIATLFEIPALRREQIRLQVALANTLMHVKGFGALESRDALEKAQAFIERAEAQGERLDDPLVLFSVLYGSWVANSIEFVNGDLVRDIAAQFLALAERRDTTAPLMVGHRLVGTSLLYTGDIAEGRAHLDRAVALYDPREHRPLTARFGHDIRMAALGFRSWAQWLLGFPEIALADADHSLKDARETGQAATLMFSLTAISVTKIFCGEYAIATALIDELVTLAEEKGAAPWKAWGLLHRGRIFALTGKPAEAIPIITSSLSASRSTGAARYLNPLFISDLAWAYALLGQNEDASLCIDEAISILDSTKQGWLEAEANRIAGADRAKIAEAGYGESARLF
jgi:tetratricopeptide (TPR) repeat protein